MTPSREAAAALEGRLPRDAHEGHGSWEFEPGTLCSPACAFGARRVASSRRGWSSSAGLNSPRWRDQPLHSAGTQCPACSVESRCLDRWSCRRGDEGDNRWRRPRAVQQDGNPQLVNQGDVIGGNRERTGAAVAGSELTALAPLSHSWKTGWPKSKGGLVSLRKLREGRAGTDPTWPEERSGSQ